MHKRIKRIGKTVHTKTSNHAPEIFTGLGIAGMITSTILAVRATPRALKILEEEKAETELEIVEVKETVKLTWKCYVPAILVGGVSVALLIWGNKVMVKRYTALAAACSLSETAFRDYRHKVIEKIGEEKEKEIHSEIAQEKLKSNPISQHQVIDTGSGNDLCFDAMSGRYFYANVQKLEKNVNDLNRRMREEMYITLNEFYWEINLDPIDVGEILGWNIDTAYIELSYDTKLTNDNRPCIVIRHINPPFYDFT